MYISLTLSIRKNERKVHCYYPKASYYKNYHLITRVLQNFDTNLKRFSWNCFGEFQRDSDSCTRVGYLGLQAEQNLISNITNFVNQLYHEFLNDSRPRILENQEIKRKSQNWLGTYVSVQSPHSEINFWQYQSKLTQKQISKFSDLFQFRLIILLFVEYLSPIVDRA